MFLMVNLNQRPVHEFIMNEFRPKMPPFGVAYVSATLRQLGVKVALHDDNLREYGDQQLSELFRRHKGELTAIGLTSVSTTLGQLKRVARLAKQTLPETPIIVGGPHARMLPQEILAVPEVDLVFTSEAELAISDYVKGKPVEEIEGVAYRRDGQVVENPVTSVINDLDSIPFPDYSLFDINEYHTTKGVGKRHPASYIITSRGCPYACTFCSSKSLNPTGKKIVRYRSPENTVAEIEWVVKEHGVRELFFSDDMFTGNTRHLTGICERLLSKNLDLVWVCMTHVNNINREKLELMKRAGCHQICFGVESGDPEIQKRINKNLDFGRVKEAVRLTRAAGIDVRCSFMFGNQFETPQTMQRTIDLAKWLAPDFASFNIATPYPGTYFRQWAIENNYLADYSYEALDSTSYILVTPDLPPGTVEAYCNQAFKSFYYRPQYVLRRLRGIRDADDVIRFLKSSWYALKSLPKILG